MGVRRHRWSAALVAVAVALVGSCGRDDASGSAAGATGAAPAITVPGSDEAADRESRPPVSPAISDLLVLRTDGLGLVSFGDAADRAVADVAALLGDPTEDTGWVDPLTQSVCSGSTFRRVTWGSLSLYAGDVGPGERSLFAYSYGLAGDLDAPPRGLATPQNIGLGTTVEFLRAAYPEVAIEPGEEGLIPPSFVIPDGPRGELTGGADDDLVTLIIGGNACGVGL